MTNLIEQLVTTLVPFQIRSTMVGYPEEMINQRKIFGSNPNQRPYVELNVRANTQGSLPYRSDPESIEIAEQVEREYLGGLDQPVIGVYGADQVHFLASTQEPNLLRWFFRMGEQFPILTCGVEWPYHHPITQATKVWIAAFAHNPNIQNPGDVFSETYQLSTNSSRVNKTAYSTTNYPAYSRVQAEYALSLGALSTDEVPHLPQTVPESGWEIIAQRLKNTLDLVQQVEGLPTMSVFSLLNI